MTFPQPTIPTRTGPGFMELVICGTRDLTLEPGFADFDFDFIFKVFVSLRQQKDRSHAARNPNCLHHRNVLVQKKWSDYADNHRIDRSEWNHYRRLPSVLHGGEYRPTAQSVQ